MLEIHPVTKETPRFKDIFIKDLTLLTAKYPALTFYNAKDVRVEGLDLLDSARPGISVIGDESENITIDGKLVD